MAAYALTDWTVTILSDVIKGKEREINASIALPAAGTYPSNGVRLPEYDSFGFRRNMSSFQIDSAVPSIGTVIKYAPSTHRLRVYMSSTGDEMATTVSGLGIGGIPELYVTVKGW